MFGNINNLIFTSNLINFFDIYMLNEVRIANIVNFETTKLYLLCYNPVNHPAHMLVPL